MTAIERIRIPLKVPELHINQQIAWDYYIARSRRVVMRAGRRFGKSTLNVAAAISIAGARRLPVGWFAPEVKHFAQQYRECLYGLKSHLVARQHNAFIHTLGGGSIDFWSLENQLAGLGRKYA